MKNYKFHISLWPQLFTVTFFLFLYIQSLLSMQFGPISFYYYFFCSTFYFIFIQHVHVLIVIETHATHLQLLIFELGRFYGIKLGNFLCRFYAKCKLLGLNKVNKSQPCLLLIASTRNGQSEMVVKIREHACELSRCFLL